MDEKPSRLPSGDHPNPADNPPPEQEPLRMTREEAIKKGYLAMNMEEYAAFQKLTPSEKASISRLLLAKQRAELAAESQVALLQHPAVRLSRNERKRRRQQR